MRNISKSIVYVLAGCTILVALFFLDINGYIWHNDLLSGFYSVKGLDISHHQGEINWEKLQYEGYKFVFMKATECNDFVDKRFEENWENAKKYGLITGAYHFFSITSSGEEQANNFLKVVPKEGGTLPPVIDIEIPTDLNTDDIIYELKNILDILEEHYEITPILYVTYDTYYAYVEGKLTGYPIWIRDVYKHPDIKIGNEKLDWTFWQYCNRGHVKGIDTFVDKNVYKGDLDELLLELSTSSK